MGLTWALAVLATVVVFARTYVTLKVLDRPGWDLFWAIVAYVRSLVGTHTLLWSLCKY